MQTSLDRMDGWITADKTEDRKEKEELTQKNSSIRKNVHPDRLLNKQAGSYHP